MSTRYVYEIYSTTAVTRQQTTEETLTVADDYDYAYIRLCNDYEAEVAYNRKGTPVTKYSSKGDSLGFGYARYNSNGAINPAFAVEDTAKYKYAILERHAEIVDSDPIIGESYLLEFSQAISGAFWHSYYDPRKYVTLWNNDSSANTSTISGKMPFYKSGGTISKGSSVVSHEARASKSLAEGAYETNGVWRWRSYLGSDNLDPYSVEYSVGTISAGEEITVTVKPRTPTYGGTVYYQYSYSTNGGSSWTNLGARTTDTSKTAVVPQGAKQYRVRVVASDNYGFTSTTYVSGINLTVLELKAYVGVDGKARPVVKIYVGVDGKAREVVKGYVGINGKARKFL